MVSSMHQLLTENILLYLENKTGNISKLKFHVRGKTADFGDDYFTPSQFQNNLTHEE